MWKVCLIYRFSGSKRYCGAREQKERPFVIIWQTVKAASGDWSFLGGGKGRLLGIGFYLRLLWSAWYDHDNEQKMLYYATTRKVPFLSAQIINLLSFFYPLSITRLLLIWVINSSITASLNLHLPFYWTTVSVIISLFCVLRGSLPCFLPITLLITSTHLSQIALLDC